MNDRVEFYRDGQYQPFLTMKSSFQPNDGDLISINKETYIVLGRSFSADYSDSPDRLMRCNVIVKKQKESK